METFRIFQPHWLKIAHVPTFLLVIGYPVFWLEMYVFKVGAGKASPAACLLFLLLICFVFLFRTKEIAQALSVVKDDFRQKDRAEKVFIVAGSVLALLILGITFYAALLPPHLIQESDAMNYHLALPRQHLILNSFRHIQWSSADLFPLPLQFALAPYWFVTTLPNKCPQFIFSLGLIAVSVNLARKFIDKHGIALFWVVFAVLGSHNVGIQLGTAMLDLVICYLFLAAVDSLMDGNPVLAGVEFAFMFWSKSFIPIQMTGLMIILGGLYLLAKTLNFKKFTLSFHESANAFVHQERRGLWKKFILVFFTAGILIGGPFVGKSLYYSGTPLYPFLPGTVTVDFGSGQAESGKQALVEAAQAHLAPRVNYGYGWSPMDFIRHFWLIAVPEKTATNRFDYPLGLVYLLFIGPFLFLLFNAIRKKTFPVIPVFIAVFWSAWWFGMQQSRLLYIPILLMYIVVVAELRIPSSAWRNVVLIALLLNVVSITRAHRHDWGRDPASLLRAQDQKLAARSESYIRNQEQGFVDLEFGEVAYARFPVRVIKRNLPFVISY